jgi:hypothetical protein
MLHNSLLSLVIVKKHFTIEEKMLFRASLIFSYFFIFSHFPYFALALQAWLYH